MLLDVDTLLTRHLPDLDATDTVSINRAGGVLAAIEQAAARWLGFPAASSEPGGQLVQSTLESRDYVLFPKSRDGERLIIRLSPVTEIGSVLLSSSGSWPSNGDDPADAQEVSADDYSQDPQQGHLVLHREPTASSAIWPRGMRRVRVVCTAGYATEADLPLGVADALYVAAADAVTRGRTRTVSNSSQGGASQTYVAPKALPADVKEVLMPYCLLGVLGVE